MTEHDDKPPPTTPFGVGLFKSSPPVVVLTPQLPPGSGSILIGSGVGVGVGSGGLTTGTTLITVPAGSSGLTSGVVATPLQSFENNGALITTTTTPIITTPIITNPTTTTPVILVSPTDITPPPPPPEKQKLNGGPGDGGKGPKARSLRQPQQPPQPLQQQQQTQGKQLPPPLSVKRKHNYFKKKKYLLSIVHSLYQPTPSIIFITHLVTHPLSHSINPPSQHAPQFN